MLRVEGVEQEAVQQIVNPTPHAPSLARFWQCFSGTLNVGNVHFYFPDSSVLSRKQVLQCGFDLFVARAPPHLPFVRLLYFCVTFVRRCVTIVRRSQHHLTICSTHTSQLFSALTLNTQCHFEIWWTLPPDTLLKHLVRQCTRASYDTTSGEQRRFSAHLQQWVSNQRNACSF